MTKPPHDTERELFDRLAETAADPYVDRMYSFARDVEQRLNRDGHIATVDEAEVAVRELDRGWSFYMGEKISVSGDVTYISGTGERRETTVVDEEVITNGFSAYKTDVAFDGETVGERWVVAHALLKDVGDLRSTLALPIASDHHIDYPYPSPELRSQRFRTEQPKLAEWVTKLGFEARGEMDVVDALRHEVYRVNYDDPIDYQRLIDFQVALNEMADFDKTLPYVVLMHGEYAVGHIGQVPHGRNANEPMSRLLNVGGLTLQPFNQPVNGIGEVVPALRGVMHSPQHHGAAQSVIIPFTSVLALKPVRQLSVEDV